MAYLCNINPSLVSLILQNIILCNYNRRIINIPSKSRDQNLKVALFKYLISLTIETKVLLMPCDEVQITKFQDSIYSGFCSVTFQNLDHVTCPDY